MDPSKKLYIFIRFSCIRRDQAVCPLYWPSLRKYLQTKLKKAALRRNGLTDAELLVHNLSELCFVSHMQCALSLTSYFILPTAL